jgi:RNA polymerase sigma-70 factor (ECF subfamily)
VATEATDAQLIARCRQGQQDAWAELVDRFSGYVYAILARGFRMPDSQAEDVFQEVFARLYERIDSIRDDAAVRSWIAKTAQRLAIDAYRARQREGPAAAAMPETGELDARLERLDEALDIKQALARLPQRCEEILTRFFIRDESYRVIADALEIPSGTVASRISRCLAKLRKEMLPNGV